MRDRLIRPLDAACDNVAASKIGQAALDAVRKAPPWPYVYGRPSPWSSPPEPESEKRRKTLRAWSGVADPRMGIYRDDRMEISQR